MKLNRRLGLHSVITIPLLYSLVGVALKDTVTYW